MFQNRSSKSGKRGFGKRRTVVQLDDEPRRQPTYGFGYKPVDEVPKPEATSNALSGLMSHYAMDSYSDDNSGDEEEEKLDNHSTSQTTDLRKEKTKWPQFVAATDTQLPSFKATGTENEKPTDTSTTGTAGGGVKEGATGEIKDDIDLKLKDFFAEIESIEVPEKPSVDDEAVDGKPLDAAADSDTDNATGMSEDDASPPTEPIAPVTVWQHCLDDGTQCYYFWNTETNEVTWEIPQGYSQFLLRYKEYERLSAKYEKEIAEWKKTHGNKKHKKRVKKDLKHNKKVEGEDELIEPLVSYPPIQEEEEEQEEQMAAEEASVVYGPQKPPDDVLKKLRDKSSAEREQSLDSTAPRSGISKKVSMLDETEVSETSGDLTLSSLPKKHHHRSSKKHTEEESTDLEMLGGSKSHDSKLCSHDNKTKSHDDNIKSKLQSSHVKDSSDGKSDGSGVEELPCSRKAKETHPQDDVDNKDEFGKGKLEEPIFTHYEYVNKKYAEELSDDMDLAIEDIDRELELALEKRQNKKEAASEDKKRKQDSCEDSTADRKRLKIDTEAGSFVGGIWKTTIKEDVQNKVKDLADILDLSSTLMEKLEFLEVSQNGLSKLQVLLIQMETRLLDWKSGGLSTDYMLQKLRESSIMLHQYEQNASPPGWSCFWDRTFKRYFYSNNTTGETSWAYPELTSAEERKSEEVLKCSLPCSGAPNYSERTSSSGEPHGRPQLSSSNDLILVHMSQSEAETEAALSIPVPSDLLSWVANPPPPPPATPPPSSPCPESPPLPLSTSESTDMLSKTEDQRLGFLTGYPYSEDSTPSQEDQSASALEESESATCQISEPPLLPGQIRASPVIATKSVTGTSVQTTTHHVHNSQDGATNSAQTQASTSGMQQSTQDGLYDGIPMEDLSSHPVKEKKKKKDKLVIGGSLSMKKKNVTSLVEKWQKIQDDVSKEIEKERSKQLKLAELTGKVTSSKND